MTFNEPNTVEHLIIHQLTGVNLNPVQGFVVKEDAVGYGSVFLCGDTFTSAAVQEFILQKKANRSVGLFK